MKKKPNCRKCSKPMTRAGSTIWCSIESGKIYYCKPCDSTLVIINSDFPKEIFRKWPPVFFVD